MPSTPECQRPGGVHEVGRNHRGIYKCKHCYTSLQSISVHPRSPCSGDYRVVCDGIDGDGVCSIGPSRPVAPVHKELAIEWYSEHQREAVRRDGTTHDAKVIQL